MLSSVWQSHQNVRDPDPGLRRAAVDALGKLLTDSDAGVRKAALGALVYVVFGASTALLSWVARFPAGHVLPAAARLLDPNLSAKETQSRLSGHRCSQLGYQRY